MYPQLSLYIDGQFIHGDGRKEQDPFYMIYSDRNCNFPQPAFATWWLTQFRRWGMVKGAPDYAGVAKRVMRPDIYMEAMKEIGLTPKVAPRADKPAGGGLDSSIFHCDMPCSFQ